MSVNRVIGDQGQLPWHYPEDLRHFRRVTLGHSIIMGRKTYESIGRPLPNRDNHVISGKSSFRAPGCTVHSSFESAVAAAQNLDMFPIVIGGAAVYERALPWTTKIWLTEIGRVVEGDTLFPKLDHSELVETSRKSSENNSEVQFVTLERAMSQTPAQ